MSDVNFILTAQDFASRKFREVGRSARWMALQVAAADRMMEQKMQHMDHTVSAVLKGIIFAGPAAAAALNAVTVAVGGLASALISMGPGLGGLGIGVLGNLGQVQQVQQQLKTLGAAVDSASTPAARRKAEAALAAYRKANLQGPFGKEFNQITRLSATKQQMGLDPHVVRMMTAGIKTLVDLMHKLTPSMQHFADITKHAFGSIKHYIDGPEFARFLHWANTVGALNFKNLLGALGNLGKFIIRIGEDFSGVGTSITGWLKKITGEWAKWAKGLKGNDNFQRFVAEAKKDGPLLVRLFNALVKTLGRLSVGLTGLGHIELKAFVWAMEQLSKLPPGMLAAIFAGFQVASLANNIQKLVTGIRASAAATKAWAAVQWVLNAALDANPIGIVVIAIAALAAGLVLAYKKSKTFREVVNKAWDGIKKGAQAVWNWLKNNFVPFFTKTIPNAFKTVKDWIKSHWSDILVGILAGPLAPAALAIKHHLGDIKQFFKDALGVLKSVGNWIKDHLVGAWHTLVDAMKAAGNWVRDHLVGAFKTLKSKLGDALDAVKSLGRWIESHFLGAMKDVKTAFGNAWQKVKDFANWVKNKIGDALKPFATALLNVAKTAVKVAKKIFDALSSAVQKVLNVAAKIPGPWQKGMQAARDAVSRFRQHADDSFNKVIGGIEKMKKHINSVPHHTKTTAQFYGSNAQAHMSQFVSNVNNKLGNIRDENVVIHVQAAPGSLQHEISAEITASRKHKRHHHKKFGARKHAAGGPITGPGSGTSDSVPAMLSNGEHVWTAEEVRAAGGHGAVRRMRDAVVGRFAKGGPVVANPFRLAARFEHNAFPMGYIHHVIMQYAHQLAKQAKQRARDALHSMMGTGSIPGGFHGSYGVGRWRNDMLKVMGMLGIPRSALPILMHRLALESGGNPVVVNRWDSNWDKGTPSVGLMQVIGPTFQAHAGKYRNVGPFLYGTSVNPIANIYAGLRYAMSRYGSSYLQVLAGSSGYRRGGYPPIGMPALVGEAGPELIIPTGPSRVVPNSGAGRDSFIRELATALADALDGATMVVDHKNLPDAVAAGRQIQHALLSLKRSNGGKHLGLT